MDILTMLGLFLLFFALIVFGAKYVLSKRTRRELEEIGDPIPQFYRSQNRMMARLIIAVALVALGLYIVFELR